MDKDMILGFAAMACHDAGLDRQAAETVMDELYSLIDSTSPEDARLAYGRFQRGELCPK